MQALSLFDMLHARYYGQAEIVGGGTFLVQMSSPLIASGIPAVVTATTSGGARSRVSCFTIRTIPVGEGNPNIVYRAFEDTWFLLPNYLGVVGRNRADWQPGLRYDLLDDLEVGCLASLPDMPHIRAKKAWGGEIPAIEEMFLERLIQREGWVAINISGSEFAFQPTQSGVQTLLSDVLPSQIQGFEYYHDRYIVVEDSDMVGALIGSGGENIRLLKEHLGHTFFVVKSQTWYEYGQVSRTLACWSESLTITLGSIRVLRWVPLWIRPGEPFNLKFGLRCTFRHRGEEGCCASCSLCRGEVRSIKDFCPTT